MSDHKESSHSASGVFGQTSDGSIQKIDLTKTEEVLKYITRHREEEIREKIGRFFHHDDMANSSSSELKVGKFQFGDDIHRIQPFVFVPIDYNFKDFDQFREIFKALNISKPELVFSFGKNYGIVPSETKKTLENWKKHWKKGPTDHGGPKAFSLPHDLIKEGANESPPVKNNVMSRSLCTGHGSILESSNEGTSANGGTNGGTNEDVDAFALNDSEDIIKVESHVENILTAIADDFKKTLFLITEPFRGNSLSEFACKAANGSRNNTPALGLFDVGSSKAVAGGDFTVLKDTTERDEEHDLYKEHLLYKDMKRKIEASKNNSTLAWDSRMSQKEAEFRLPVPRSIFELCTVPLGDTPRSVIKVDCEFTKYEKEVYDYNNRVQHIPGGLANECSHLLVFATRGQKQEFIKVFSDTSAMGQFACGSTESEMKLAVRALNQGNPLFILAGTGPVATIMKTFHERDILDNNQKPLEIPPFMNENALDEASLLDATSNDHMINHFNPEAYYVIQRESSCDQNGRHNKHASSRIQEIKDEITKVMATAFDFNNEIGGDEEDKGAIDLCENLVNQIEIAEARYKTHSTTIHILIQVLLLLVIITSVRVVACKNKKGENDECGENFLNGLETIGLALPIIAAALQATDKAFRFDAKYANLLIAKVRLESEKFYFRARIGIYSSLDNLQGRKNENVRKIFMKTCNDLYEDCMKTEVKEGALYSHFDRIRGKSRKNPKEQDFMPSNWFRKAIMYRYMTPKYEKWQGKQMTKTIQAWEGWKRRNDYDGAGASAEAEEAESGNGNEAADVETPDESDMGDSGKATEAESGNGNEAADVENPHESDMGDSGKATEAESGNGNEAADVETPSGKATEATKLKATKIKRKETRKIKRKEIRHLKLLTPLEEVQEVWEKKERNKKMGHTSTGEEIRRLKEHKIHFYGMEEDHINEIGKIYKKLRKVKEKKYYKDRYSIISVDDYVKIRLLPKQKEFQKSLPTYTLLRNLLQILVIFLTAFSTYFVAKKREDLVPIILGVVALCEAIRNDFYLDSRSPILHLVNSRLEQIKFDVRGLGVLDKRLPSFKKDIIYRAEEAILSNYMFLAESALASQQKREDKEKEDLENVETRGHSPSS